MPDNSASPQIIFSVAELALLQLKLAAKVEVEVVDPQTTMTLVSTGNNRRVLRIDDNGADALASIDRIWVMISFLHVEDGGSRRISSVLGKQNKKKKGFPGKIFTNTERHLRSLQVVAYCCHGFTDVGILYLFSATILSNSLKEIRKLKAANK